MPRPLSTIVLLGLLAACAAAFAITEHLKLVKSPMYATRVTKVFSPVCKCATDRAEISFKLRRPDTVTVSIVDSGGKVVDIVRAGVRRQAQRATFHWNGRTTDGKVAADGWYQPEVDLKDARRTILMPNRITVDTSVPTVTSASDGDGILIAGGHHGITIEYAFGGNAHAAVYFGHERVLFGHRNQPQGTVKWSGTRNGHELPAGRYVLHVAAVDVAGNETPLAGQKRVAVLIRYVALSSSPARVAPGASFTVGVRTAAKTYTWTFAGKHGSSSSRTLRLHAPSKRGRYRLVVSAHGHAATARVIVGDA